MTETEFQQYIEDSRLAGRFYVLHRADAMAAELGLVDFDYRFFQALREANGATGPVEINDGPIVRILRSKR